MPCAVRHLLEHVGLDLGGSVQWGRPVPADYAGVYLVSLDPDPLGLSAVSEAPVCTEAVRAWIDGVHQIRLDGAAPTVAGLADRLRGFWLPDEVVLYIGKANRPLRERVGEFYGHVLGNRSPHRGGSWMKTLCPDVRLTVFWARVEDPEAVEGALVGEFVRKVSRASRCRLHDQAHPFPFANLEYPRGTRKQHGITDWCR